MSERSKYVLVLAVLSCMAYVGVSSVVYRFRHPEMTETETIMNMGAVLRWEK